MVISSYIEIENTADTKMLCTKYLTVDNPEYIKKKRMNLWYFDTPRILQLFEILGDKIRVPYGFLYTLEKEYLKTSKEKITDYTTVRNRIELTGDVPLYDYQQKAVDSVNKRCGIIKAPAGSGKTQIGIALIKKLGVKALWLTHTKDLLNQSKKRYLQYFDKKGVGTITEGKVNIGKNVTFATVQTMAKLDLSLYANEFDLIIVDECHNVSGTPTRLNRFYKVLTHLSARYKYGLTATLHRGDGLVKATKTIIGDVIVEISEEEVKGKILKVGIKRVDVNISESSEYTRHDGTLDWNKIISYITKDEKRNKKIINLISNDHNSLILSDRVNHLKILYELLPSSIKKEAVILDAKTKKEVREKAIEEMRKGSKKHLFATYSLAKEGLDIPRLDRLYLTTPKSDYAVIVQSIGRIARTFKGKKEPIAYDFVDSIFFLKRKYKERWKHYKTIDCYEVVDG